MTGLGLLNPLHVFYPIPNVACNSRHLCYSTISILSIRQAFFGKFRLISAVECVNKQNPNETLHKRVHTRNVLGLVKYPCVQIHHSLPTKQIFHLNLQQNNYRSFLLRFCRSLNFIKYFFV